MDAVIPKEFREKFKESGETLTRSPHVNDLIKSCREVKEGKLDKEALRDPINRLYDTYDALRVSYETLLPTQPKTEDLEIKSKILLASMEGFRNALDEITIYFGDENPEHLDLGLKNLRSETDTIMNIIDELRADEEKVKVHSHSPQLNELVRIGKGIIKGDFKPDYLKPRFEIAKDIYEDTYTNVQEITKNKPDTKTLEEQTPLILEALEEFKYGLDMLQKYFDQIEEGQENPVDLLKKSIDQIEEASMKVYEVQMILKKELEETYAPPKRLCPRCSYELPPNATKFCPECRAMLPQMAVTPQSSVDISEAPTAPQNQEQVMVPPHVKKVYDAAWSVVKGTIKKEEFKEIIDWFEKNIKDNEGNMKELLKTPKNITPEEEKLFDKVRESSLEGVKNCLEGIEEMRLYLDDDDKSHLENGLAQLMRGGDQLYGVREIGRKASKGKK